MASPSATQPLTLPAPSTGATPVPGARKYRTRHSRDDADADSSTEGEDMDPNEFDLMVSRSWQAGGGMLEPEVFEHSMLRNTRRRSRNRSTVRRDQTLSPYRAPRADPQKAEQPEPLPDESSPLLPSSAATATESFPSDICSGSKASPYLGGVSVARFWIIFAGIEVAYFVACFDSTIMASSHPVITSYFGSSNRASWLSTAFLLTSTAFQPFLGGLSDAVGRKGPYVITTTLFLVATLWCTLAGSMTSFIIARAVCGAGAGGMMALGSIIISDLVPIEIRGPFQSYVNMTYGLGAMLGAGLGGMMADLLGWRWEFGVQVPIIVVCVVLAVMTIPDDLGLYGKQRQSLGEAMQTFDFAGSFLMCTSITALVLGLGLGGNILPWSHPLVMVSLTAFAILFPLFLYAETRAAKPIMPIYLVKQSPHMNLLFSNHIAAFLSNAILFNIPLFFQGVLLTTATTSGLRLVLSSLVSSTAGTSVGFLITYTRRLKWPLVLGSVLLVLGTLCLASMQRGWPAFVYVLFLVPAAAGQGFQFPGTFMAILAVADQRSQAVVTSTLILWRNLGMVLGVAVSSLVVQNALWGYLEVFVEGPEKEAVIGLVRQSVEAIRDLPEMYREQVVRSYEAALRATFLMCTGLAVASMLLILPLRLPRLGRRNVK